jgi:hypothetical protein
MIFGSNEPSATDYGSSAPPSSVTLWTRQLPPIKAVVSCTLPATKRHANEPEDGKYHRSDPQDVHRKTGSGQNQNQQKQ